MYGYHNIRTRRYSYTLYSNLKKKHGYNINTLILNELFFIYLNELFALCLKFYNVMHCIFI